MIKISLHVVILAFTVFFIISQKTQANETAGIGETYVNIAHHIYSDSLTTANHLSNQIDLFLDTPSEDNQELAKDAWRKARSIYSQSEVFRFGNPVVDEWESQVNAWPLDEGFIDYVDDENYFYELGNPVGKANIINSKTLTWGPNQLDLSTITSELLSSLNELGGTEANVATGWHAIEFLLWGQDLNGTEAGAGNRPATDFATDESCTNNNCERRRQYLKAVTELLVSDLEYIVDAWDKQKEASYAQEFLTFDTDEQIIRILYGIGSLALGELSGERMKVALLANSTEDEHDCFSDNTHSTLYNNALGIDTVIRGSYKNSSGKTISGNSLLSWTEEDDPDLTKALNHSLSNSLQSLSKITESAESGIAFDQLIAPGNQEGAKLINASIDSLKVLTLNIELVAASMMLGTLNPDNAGHSF